MLFDNDTTPAFHPTRRHLLGAGSALALGGLLPAAARTAAGQRSYGQADLGRLSFIRRCRDFGFSVEQVRELV
eukprot:gene40726-53881_t